MTWDNYGKIDKNNRTWNIDHIKPVSSFFISSYLDKDFKECWKLENLRPLGALENIMKSNKILFIQQEVI